VSAVSEVIPPGLLEWVPVPPTTRTLWLLRHAKTVTDPPPEGTDFDRVLAPRGRRDATALGRLFAGKADQALEALALPRSVPLPTVALVSPAARTAATADLVLANMTQPPECRLEPWLYHADPDDVIAGLRELEDEVPAAMVVGHNPTAHALSVGLIAASDKKGAALATKAGFPTTALGIYRFKVARWRELEAHTAKLLALFVPPYGGH
jgi:phosphohistidine phosphatase